MKSGSIIHNQEKLGEILVMGSGRFGRGLLLSEISKVCVSALSPATQQQQQQQQHYLQLMMS